MPSSAALLTDLGFVLLALANLPLAAMFAAIAVDTATTRSLPVWSGWVAAAAAIGDVALAVSVATPSGALAPQGRLAYVFYLLPRRVARCGREPVGEGPGSPLGGARLTLPPVFDLAG